MQEFKVGDKVKCIKGSSSHTKGSGWELGFVFVITKITSGDPKLYWEGKYENGVYEPFLKLATPKNPKVPTHLVVWDESGRDPNKFLTNENEAKDFIKELSEKSDVVKDSIILVEIKSAKKVSIQKSLRYNQHKI